VQPWPAIVVPAFTQERTIAPGAKLHAWPAAQPHWGEVSLQGDSEQPPLVEVEVVVDEDELVLVVEPVGEPVPVLVTVASVPVELPPTELPPMPMSDAPRAQAMPASTATEMVRSKPERMAHLARGAYADRLRGQRLPRGRWNTIRSRPGPA
jgi:hypothetical protein